MSSFPSSGEESSGTDLMIFQSPLQHWSCSVFHQGLKTHVPCHRVPVCGCRLRAHCVQEGLHARAQGPTGLGGVVSAPSPRFSVRETCCIMSESGDEQTKPSRKGPIRGRGRLLQKSCYLNRNLGEKHWPRPVRALGRWPWAEAESFLRKGALHSRAPRQARQEGSPRDH